MIKESTIKQVERILKQLRDLRDAEYPGRSEMRSHFNAGADKLDLLASKLHQDGKKCLYTDGDTYKPRTFNDGVDAAIYYIMDKAHVTQTIGLFTTTRICTEPGLKILADALKNLKVKT